MTAVTTNHTEGTASRTYHNTHTEGILELSCALFVFLLRIFAAYCTRHGVAEGYALVVVGDVIFARPRGFGLRPYAAIHGRIRPIPLLESN